MKKEILLELINRWEYDAKSSIAEDGAVEAEIPNAIARGIREGKRECADGLRTLIQLLGD